MAEMKERPVTTEYKLYQKALNVKNKHKVNETIKQSQDFYNGNQYPNENYKNMPRVTMNICSFEANIKASKVVGTPIYFTFTASDNKTDTIALQRFDEYNCKKLKAKANNYISAINGYSNGTEVAFMRWDNDDTTYQGIYKGGLALEHINLENFAVANIRNTEIQKQRWVMFWKDADIESLLDLIEADSKKEREEKIELLKSDIETGSDGKVDASDLSFALVRLYTRYFRKDGEVYFVCSTKSCELFKHPHALSRKLAAKEIEKKLKAEEEGYSEIEDYDIDGEDVEINSTSKTKYTDEAYKQTKEKFSLYPFARFTPLPINDFFYGRSDVKQIIPIQKALNFIISMMLKCVENTAYNKILAKADALQNQEITNEAGQVIIDYSKYSNSWGIKTLESQAMPNGLFDLADRLLAMTRVIFGFNDVMDGSVTNQDMSGYMLQQMIKQSNTSIEQQQQLFWTFQEELAAIRLMFYKHYVDKAKYSYQIGDVEYQGEEQARQQLLNQFDNEGHLAGFPEAKKEDFKQPVHKTKVKEIDIKELWGTNFDISIEAMQGLNESKLAEQQMWDNLLLNGNLQAIDPEILDMYIQASPNISQHSKTELRNLIENLKESENYKLKEKMKELLGYTQELVEVIKKYKANSQYTDEYIKNLTNEYTGKINQANAMNEALMKDLQAKAQEKEMPKQENVE